MLCVYGHDNVHHHFRQVVYQGTTCLPDALGAWQELSRSFQALGGNGGAVVVVTGSRGIGCAWPARWTKVVFGR